MYAAAEPTPLYRPGQAAYEPQSPLAFNSAAYQPQSQPAQAQHAPPPAQLAPQPTSHVPPQPIAQPAPQPASGLALQPVPQPGAASAAPLAAQPVAQSAAPLATQSAGMAHVQPAPALQQPAQEASSEVARQLARVSMLKKIVNDQQAQIKDSDKAAGANKLLTLAAHISAEPGMLEVDGAFGRWKRDVPLLANPTAHIRRISPTAARPLDGTRGARAAPASLQAQQQQGFVGTSSLSRWNMGDDPEIVGRLEDALRVLATKASVLSERSNRLHSTTLSSTSPYGYGAPETPLSASRPLPAHVESALQKATSHANGAPMTPSASPRAGHRQEAAALSRMSEQEVAAWLQTVGLGEYGQVFVDAGFSGNSLTYLHTLANSSPATFFEKMEGLGMKMGHAARLADVLRTALAG